MITEKDTIKCEAIFNDDKTHRFLLKRIWDKDKPAVAIVMLNPSLSDNIIDDTTTTLCINNVARLENYGGVQIVNLYSLLTPKLNFRWNSDEDLNAPENDEYIKKAANECEVVVLAWGRSTANNDRIADRAVAVVNMLLKHKDKLVVISDGERSGLHPLTPALRNSWILESLDFKSPEDYKVQITEKYREEAKPRKKAKKEEEPIEDSPTSFEVISDENSGNKENTDGETESEETDGNEDTEETTADNAAENTETKDNNDEADEKDE